MVHSPSVPRPAFLITIDTEGDNLWAHPCNITTENAKHLVRFQSLCESYGFKPTYLTNYEMAVCPVYREFALDVIHRGAAEIGMHLHAWNSPPLIPLTADDYRFQPYLTEYPEPVMREKIHVMTRMLEEQFQISPASHRSGRWAFNEVYARLLSEAQYKVDCSVAPKTSYKGCLGDPNGTGGPDYTQFPDSPYFLNLDNIGVPGDSQLLELPVTIMDFRPAWARGISRRSLLGRVVNRLSPAAARLRPDGKNLGAMLRIVRQAIKERRSYVEFMLHSSELMAGGSPSFPDAQHIETLYQHLEEFFNEVRGSFTGATLTEFYRALTEGGAGASLPAACSVRSVARERG